MARFVDAIDLPLPIEQAFDYRLLIGTRRSVARVDVVNAGESGG